MSIVAMQKVRLVSLLENKDAVLNCLQKNEVIDIREVKTAPAAGPEQSDQARYDYELAEIKSAIAFLESIEPRKKTFVESFIPPRDELPEAEFSKICREFDCAGLVKQCEAVESRLANLHNLINELKTEQEKLLPWLKLDRPLNSLTGTEHTSLTAGKVRGKNLADFQKKLRELEPASHLEIVHQTKEDIFVVVIALATAAKEVKEFLARSEFNALPLPEIANTPAQETERIRRAIRSAEAEARESRAEARELAGRLNQLKYRYDLVLEKKAGSEIKQKMADTKYTFALEGWIKAADLDRLKQELNKVTGAQEVFRIAPDKDEQPPVALHNPVPFSPFELITQIYGTPKPGDWDPSIPLSFFFALFFGLCLGDLGYGLVLAAFSLYFMKKHKLPAGGKKLFQLLVLGGGVAALVGLLTGSYFGFTPKDIPEALGPARQFLTGLQIVDPIKTPLTMLIFSLALGVVQILFGVILQLALRIREKDYVSAFLDDGLWLFFLSSLVFLIAASALSLPSAFLASRLSLAGAVALVLTQGRHKKNIIQKLLSGLLSLYKLSGYMGDTLSYSRLLALGMSTTIIGSVINILAGMVKGGVPVLGIILMAALLVFGHIFNLVIGTLGAFVHSTRLQMVEFFSKFYEGGGREFRPYKRQAEYTVLK